MGKTVQSKHTPGKRENDPYKNKPDYLYWKQEWVQAS